MAECYRHKFHYSYKYKYKGKGKGKKRNLIHLVRMGIHLEQNDGKEIYRTRK